MTEQEITDWKSRIDGMGHAELARLHRFAPLGHPVFDMQYPALQQHFRERFNSFGGMTYAVSKQIGLDP